VGNESNLSEKKKLSTSIHGAVRSSDVARFKHFGRAATNGNLMHEETDIRSNWVKCCCHSV
jgi:hypothetical protein